MYKNDINILPDYAMFGENLTLVDLDENDVYFEIIKRKSNE